MLLCIGIAKPYQISIKIVDSDFILLNSYIQVKIVIAIQIICYNYISFVKTPNLFVTKVTKSCKIKLNLLPFPALFKIIKLIYKYKYRYNYHTFYVSCDYDLNFKIETKYICYYPEFLIPDYNCNPYSEYAR